MQIFKFFYKNMIYSFTTIFITKIKSTNFCNFVKFCSVKSSQLQNFISSFNLKKHQILFQVIFNYSPESNRPIYIFFQLYLSNPAKSISQNPVLSSVDYTSRIYTYMCTLLYMHAYTQKKRSTCGHAPEQFLVQLCM